MVVHAASADAAGSRVPTARPVRHRAHDASAFEAHSRGKAVAKATRGSVGDGGGDAAAGGIARASQTRVGRREALGGHLGRNTAATGLAAVSRTGVSVVAASRLAQAGSRAATGIDEAGVVAPLTVSRRFLDAAARIEHHAAAGGCGFTAQRDGSLRHWGGLERGYQPLGPARGAAVAEKMSGRRGTLRTA